MQNIDKAIVQAFFDRQVSEWDTAKNNYEALQRVKVKEFRLGNALVKGAVQSGAYCFVGCQGGCQVVERT